jgi:hypothetical protein
LRGAAQVRAAQQRFRPLVYIPQAFLQPHDGLAACRETEMARLDDARVDRAHRDLVQVLALRGKKPVGTGGFAGDGVAAERRPDPPPPMIEPRARIRRAFRLMSVQVADRALQPVRGRERSGHGREPAVFAVMAQHGDERAPFAGHGLGHGHVHRPRVGPQAGQRPVTVREVLDRGQPLIARHAPAWPRAVLRDGRALLEKFGQ